jgi:hypothetical protein
MNIDCCLNLLHSFLFRARSGMVSGVLLSLSVLSVGCGGGTDPLGRQAVFGEVTLNGAPLANGTIRFEPLGVVDPKVNSTAAGTVIAAGQYSLPQAEGLPPGKYKVSIGSHGDESSQTLPADPQAAMDAAAKLKPLQELIPAKYNSQTELVMEVAKDGTKPFDFDLISEKK